MLCILVCWCARNLFPVFISDGNLLSDALFSFFFFPPTHAYNQYILRNKLYHAILRSFAEPPRWPETARLKDDLQVMVNCWLLLENDKTYCRDLDSAVKSKYNARVFEFSGKRNLAMLLVRHEILRYGAWHNPTAQVGCVTFCSIPQASKARSHR